MPSMNDIAPVLSRSTINLPDRYRGRRRNQTEKYFDVFSDVLLVRDDAAAHLE